MRNTLPKQNAPVMAKIFAAFLEKHAYHMTNFTQKKT